MDTRKLWILAALLIAGCGGSNEPGTDATASGEPAAAEGGLAPREASSAAEPELLTTNPGGSAPTSERFQMGVHYARLSPTQPTSSGPDKVEVAEVFWYGCPHCFSFDPYLERWQPAAAEYVSFVRVPAVWNDLLQLHARAFYTAEALGKGGEMHGEFFREVHDRGNMLDSEAKLQEFFGRFGVDAAAFKTAFDSFAVNGKYTTDGGQAGSYEDLLALVDELTAAEHEGR
jgi:thiol:disulfide interchange protein DsbA